MNIILIWLRGVWKTYYWKLFSKNLWYDFVDTDDLIENKIWLRASDIINRYWWEKFRSIEKDIVDDIIKIDNTVIATWWWLPCYFDNAAKVKKLWKVVWIKASIQYMNKMIWKSWTSSRPSITWKWTKEEIEDLIKIRYPIFESISDLILDVDKTNSEELIKDIGNYLSKTSNKKGQVDFRRTCSLWSLC